MNKFFALLKKPKRAFAAVICRLFIWLPDATYLKMRYRLLMGAPLNLKNPKTFNEKINWLKIYNRNPLYPSLVDKSTVKDYVAKKIGEEYVIPTYGVWDSFNEIDFDSLPGQFVLKSTNGGGGTGVIVCRDKSSLDKEKVKSKLEKSMRQDGRLSREWPYEFIKPRILAEKLMLQKCISGVELCNTQCFLGGNSGHDLKDYKIFCFNGEPKLLFLASDRYTEGECLKFDWYDANLNHLSITSQGYPHSKEVLEMFPQWEEMKDVARKLSHDIPFVRVDLYLIDSKIYFGELTFFHDAGFVPLEPMEWEYKLGEKIELPAKII